MTKTMTAYQLNAERDALLRASEFHLTTMGEFNDAITRRVKMTLDDTPMNRNDVIVHIGRLREAYLLYRKTIETNMRIIAEHMDAMGANDA